MKRPPERTDERFYLVWYGIHHQVTVHVHNLNETINRETYDVKHTALHYRRSFVLVRTQRELRRVTPNEVNRDAPKGGELKTQEVSLRLQGSGEKKGANSRKTL